VPRVPTEEQRSAGGVLYRSGASGKTEICLIATRGSTRWQLPKGHVSEGETEAQGAVREVREETGCAGTAEDDLGEIVFWFIASDLKGRRRIRKRVHFFLVHYVSGETRDHDGEVDDAAWYDAEVALRRLTFDSERQILEKALGVLRQKRAPASPQSEAL
jgi:8-oxo-dGTP diphosphatase